MFDQEIDMQRELLTVLRRRLAYQLAQAAQLGPMTPPGIALDIPDARQQIRRIKALLRKYGVSVEDQPDDDSPVFTTITTDYSPLGEEWLSIISAQGEWEEQNRVSPRLQAFFSDICRRLDFAIVPESYYVHDNLFVMCFVKAPTLHLNIPTEFPLIMLIEDRISGTFIDAMINLSHLTGKSPEFGLIFIWREDSSIQDVVDSKIRPAMQSDLIVLGADFLTNMFYPHQWPRELLLKTILREVDLNRISPFRAGGTKLIDSMFFGREVELKNIADTISKTSAVISCGRRMGKTTLLDRLARVVLPARGHSCFFLNCQPIHNYHELLAEMTTTWQRSDLPFDPNRPNSFSQVVTTLANSTRQPPIFLLDEVDEMLKFDDQNQQRLFKQLRALTLDGRARFIMTGERSLQVALHNANSPLFNFFGLNLRLSFLDPKAASKLIIEPLRDMQVELSDQSLVVQMILNATSGHPYLVQRLCQDLVLTISQQDTRSIVPEHINMILDDGAYQQDYFETMWGQAPFLARVIMMIVGPKDTTIKDIQERLRQYSLNPSLREIKSALEVLELYSILVRRGGHYSFGASAFTEMLHRAYGSDLETNIELLCEEYRWEQQGSSSQALYFGMEERPMSGLEPIAAAAVTKAVDFLFDQAGKLLEERREARKQRGEEDDAPQLQSQIEVTTKEEVKSWQPKNIYLKDIPQEVEHCIKMIHQYRQNKRSIEDTYPLHNYWAFRANEACIL